MLAKSGFDVSHIRKTINPLLDFIEHAKRLKIPIAYIKSYYDLKYLSHNIIESYVSKGLIGLCNSKKWGSEFYMIYPNKNVFIKHRYDAFSNLNLEKWLKKKRIKTILFAGCQTDVCVESTARSAFVKGYNVVFVKDCLASISVKSHENSLSFFRKYCNAEMI